MDLSENPFWQSFAFHFSDLEGFQPNPRDQHHLRLFRYFRAGAESELPKDARSKTRPFSEWMSKKHPHSSAI